MADIHQKNKMVIGQLRSALYDLNADALPGQLKEIFHPDCEIHLAYPFKDLTGPGELYERAYQPLIEAVPDLERRDYIVIAGPSVADSNWVGCCGNYVGVFERPWLDIPPTFHPVVMRFHEFYRLEEGKVMEMQALWDIPQVMMQARAWPMTPSLGVEWVVPAPATQDGIVPSPRDEEQSARSLQLVQDMIAGLLRFAEGGHEGMNMEAYWHPKMTWYGPAGIGTNRRLSGFRNWHQVPWLKAMPDRGIVESVNHYYFSDGPYVAVTAWPGMKCTITHDGLLGIPPTGKELTMCSLDFWRCENGTLRENWVLVDILDVYNQLGVDVFSRMREISVGRQQKRPHI